jgi:DNA-binding CsgD family transcriptional regulator
MKQLRLVLPMNFTLMNLPTVLCYGLRTQAAPSKHDDDADLSDKEIQVLKLMCDEKSTKEIAEIVEISPRTVEAIRDRLKIKTGAKSTAGLILYAVKHGLIES